MATSALRTGSAGAALVCSFALACVPAPEDGASGPRESPSAAVSDQVHGKGVPGFFWLPPIARPAEHGRFQRGLRPEVVIERLPLGSAPPVARLTASEAGWCEEEHHGKGHAGGRHEAERHRRHRHHEHGHYRVNWHTRSADLVPAATYRIRVLVDGWFEAGFADVVVVPNRRGLRHVDRDELVPLLDGRTLPIRFRLGPESMLCPRRGPCQPLDGCHLAGVCDPFTGLCSDPVRPDGSACSDGDACTRADACRAGACVGADPVACAALDACHDAGRCDPATGACSNPAKPDGTACDDGDFCTAAAPCAAGTSCSVADACVAGVCEGAPLACDDGDACTVDGCSPDAAGTDGVTGCVNVPDRTLAACQDPTPPPPAVAIVGLRPGADGFFANQRLNFVVRLAATAERADLDLEFLAAPAGVQTLDVPAVPLGTWRLPRVEPGEREHWVELAIPATLFPGAWEIVVHEYPASDVFFPGQGDPPLVLVVEASPELPVLDLTALEVAQAALLVDPGATVPADPAVRRDAPFAADVELVARNAPAARVPVTAHLVWNGAPVPLRLWDPARSAWAERLVVEALEADAPTGLFLELALAEPDAARIRAELGGAPRDARVVVTVNGDGSVPEAECVVDEAAATVGCRHAAEDVAVVYGAAPAPVARTRPSAASAAAFAEAAAAGNTSPLRYERAWSKSIGNDWARAGLAFTGYAQLSGAGYEALARGTVPVRLLGFPEFSFVDASARADALVETGVHVDVTARILGRNVFQPFAVAGTSVTVDLADVVELPSVEKTRSFKKTVIVYVVPVTFELGATAEVGLQGSVTGALVVGKTPTTDEATLTLTGGPFAKAEGFGRGSVGLAFLGAGAQVTLVLVDAQLGAEASGTLTLTKDGGGRPLEIAGGLSERLFYETSFMNGRVGLVVTYPTFRWCGWRWFRFPCGFQAVTKEAVLCSWPGFAYEDDLLTASQDLFTIDVCEPTLTCEGLCGAIDDGCGGQDCTCPAGQSCGSDGRCVVTGFAYPGLYDVQHRWGGAAGTWLDESGDARARDITVHADGRVFRGGAPIVNPVVGPNTIRWSMADGNGTDGDVTFMDGSANAHIWGPAGRAGVLFEAADPGGIRFPGEGWLDFRGVRTCVPVLTCPERCGPTFDGCATVDCGPCRAP
jgi:hypothetical protein